MTWVMLIKKVPTRPSPPKYSIFWATPAEAANIYSAQVEQYYDPKTGKWWDGIDESDEEPDEFYPDQGRGGKEENAKNWLKIVYAGVDITVQPHEFSVLTPKRMRGYVFEIDPDIGQPVYTLEQNSEASKLMLQTAMDTDLRAIYDAALLDGCGDEMASMVVMQMDITDDAVEFPPVGWYKPVLGLGVFEVIADEWELEETPPMNTIELAAIHRNEVEQVRRLAEESTNARLVERFRKSGRHTAAEVIEAELEEIKEETRSEDEDTETDDDG